MNLPGKLTTRWIGHPIIFERYPIDEKIRLVPSIDTPINDLANASTNWQQMAVATILLYLAQLGMF